MCTVCNAHDWLADVEWSLYRIFFCGCACVALSCVDAVRVSLDASDTGVAVLVRSGFASSEQDMV